MKEDENIIEPRLPRDLLPPELPPADAAAWALRREQVMARLEPALAPLATGDDVSWLTSLGGWWKPAAAAAAAAVVFVALADVPSANSTESLPLSVLAARGEPVSLWEGLGADADPVLALIVTQSAVRGR